MSAHAHTMTVWETPMKSAGSFDFYADVPVIF